MQINKNNNPPVRIRRSGVETEIREAGAAAFLDFVRLDAPSLFCFDSTVTHDVIGESEFGGNPMPLAVLEVRRMLGYCSVVIVSST